MKLLSRLLVILVAAVCTSNTSVSAGGVPDSAESIQPLLIGSKLPSMALTTPDGKRYDVSEATKTKPTVLVFYRGGWCPYCNTHLGQLQAAESGLIELGYQVLAISPDRPEKLAESADRHKLGYQLLSDSDMSAARSLGIAFRVDDETVKLYKNKYGIDLEGDSGQTHHQLPVPAVYIVNRGIMKFSHINPDYKTRLSPDVILAAARAALVKH